MTKDIIFIPAPQLHRRGATSKILLMVIGDEYFAIRDFEEE
jgi:hypothetical protein